MDFKIDKHKYLEEKMYTNQSIQKSFLYVRQIYALGGQCLNHCTE